MASPSEERKFSLDAETEQLGIPSTATTDPKESVVKRIRSRIFGWKFMSSRRSKTQANLAPLNASTTKKSLVDILMGRNSTMADLNPSRHNLARTPSVLSTVTQPGSFVPQMDSDPFAEENLMNTSVDAILNSPPLGFSTPRRQPKAHLRGDSLTSSRDDLEGARKCLWPHKEHVNPLRLHPFSLECPYDVRLPTPMEPPTEESTDISGAETESSSPDSAPSTNRPSVTLDPLEVPMPDEETIEHKAHPALSNTNLELLRGVCGDLKGDSRDWATLSRQSDSDCGAPKLLTPEKEATALKRHSSPREKTPRVAGSQTPELDPPFISSARSTLSTLRNSLDPCERAHKAKNPSTRRIRLNLPENSGAEAMPVFRRHVFASLSMPCLPYTDEQVHVKKHPSPTKQDLDHLGDLWRGRMQELQKLGVSV